MNRANKYKPIKYKIKLLKANKNYNIEIELSVWLKYIKLNTEIKNSKRAIIKKKNNKKCYTISTTLTTDNSSS